MRLAVETQIRNCNDSYQDRYGKTSFNCWLCRKTVSGSCGGFSDIEATISGYLADLPAGAPPEEVIQPGEQLSFF